MRELNKGFVYVILAQNLKGDSFFKIGSSSNDPKGRLRQLQTGCPHKLELLSVYYLESYQTFERYLHGKLKDHNTSGEWFTVNDFTAQALGDFSEKNHNSAVAKIFENGVLTFGMVNMATAYLKEREEIDKREVELLEQYYGEWKEGVSNV